MPEPESPGGIWNTEALFYGEAPPPPPASDPFAGSAPPSDPFAASPPPSDPFAASPPPSEAFAASAPPDDTSDPFYPPPPWAAPPPPAYPSQPDYPQPSPSYPPPVAAPAPGGGVRKSVVVGVAAAVVAVLAVVAVFAVVGNRGEPQAETVSFVNSPAPASPSEDPTTAEPQPTGTEPTLPQPTEAQPSTESTPDALAQLQTLSLEGLAQVTFHGQYAAQIASKYPGIDDPLQTTAAGSHIFTAADILAEHVSLRDAHRSAEHPVILLKSTDYGKRQLIGAHFLWVTFAIGDFPDKQSVHDWCDAQFADLGEQQRANQCVARRLDPGR